MNTEDRVDRGEGEIPVVEEFLLSGTLEDPFASNPTKDTIKGSPETLSPFVKSLLRTHTEKKCLYRPPTRKSQFYNRWRG